MPVDYLNRFAQWLIETVWPTRCASCGRIGAVACNDCLKLLTPLSPLRCPGCQRPSRGGRSCSACRSRTFIDRAVAATAFTDTAEAFIHSLKYRGVRALCGPLSLRLCDIIHTQQETQAIFATNPTVIPVPLHAIRLRERGFNQAELIAQHIARITAMPLDTTSLVRIRETGQQVRTSGRIERRENMLGAFGVSEVHRIEGRDILLVDDVVTTGATLEDCARALKEAGARSVSALTFAHG